MAELPRGSGVPLPDAEETIRVRIVAHREREPMQLRIGRAGEWLRVTSIAMPHWSLTAAAPLLVQRDERGWRVTEQTGFMPGVPTEDTLVVAVLDQPHDALLQLNGRNYPGVLYLHPQPSFDSVALDVVNHVPLERYLPGVLARELFQHWHYETYLAQAITARSFAISEMHFFRDRRHYDVTDTQQSQAYIGHTDHPHAVQAVEATHGMVLTWRNELVPAYYSAACGGVAARACDAINDHPANCITPLNGSDRYCDCTASPRYEWSVQRNDADLTRRWRVFGEQAQIAALQAIENWHAVEAAELNEFGRPMRYDILDASGEPLCTIDAGLLQRASNYHALHVPPFRQALSSSFFTVERREQDVVVFSGRGHGHGAGMCQYGAQYLAMQGEKHTDILTLYYPEADITKVY